MLFTFSNASLIAASSLSAWRTADSSGTNAAYLLLQSYGVEVIYKEFADNSPLDSDSVPTLASVAFLVKAHGLDVTLRQVSPTSLAELPDFVVAHVDETNQQSTGAFLLVTSMDDEYVWYVECATCCMWTMRRDTFERIYSGYALIPRADASPKFVLALRNIAVAGAVALLIAFFLARLPLFLRKY